MTAPLATIQGIKDIQIASLQGPSSSHVFDFTSGSSSVQAPPLVYPLSEFVVLPCLVLLCL